MVIRLTVVVLRDPSLNMQEPTRGLVVNDLHIDVICQVVVALWLMYIPHSGDGGSVGRLLTKGQLRRKHNRSGTYRSSQDS